MIYNDSLVVNGITCDGDTVTIDGNATLNDNWFINGAKMVVNGDLTLSEMKFVLDGGSLEVNGDCICDFDGSTYWFDRGFKMTDKDDYIAITGKLDINASGSCEFSAGVLELKGDAYLYGFYTNNSWFKGTHKTHLMVYSA